MAIFFKFKALYDNTIQDGPIEEEFIAQNIQQADDIAHKESKQEGYVEGKYNVFTELAGTWVNIDVIYAITSEGRKYEPVDKS